MPAPTALQRAPEELLQDHEEVTMTEAQSQEHQMALRQIARLYITPTGANTPEEEEILQ